MSRSSFDNRLKVSFVDEFDVDFIIALFEILYDYFLCDRHEGWE
jgi:hypothetical protein